MSTQLERKKSGICCWAINASSIQLSFSSPHPLIFSFQFQKIDFIQINVDNRHCGVVKQIFEDKIVTKIVYVTLKIDPIIAFL